MCGSTVAETLSSGFDGRQIAVRELEETWKNAAGAALAGAALGGEFRAIQLVRVPCPFPAHRSCRVLRSCRHTPTSPRGRLADRRFPLLLRLVEPGARPAADGQHGLQLSRRPKAGPSTRQNVIALRRRR
jgi:hypothetical protein